MAVVTGNADQVQTGPGRILVAPFGTALPSDMGVGGVAPALDAALVEVGFTTEGSELEVTQESSGVPVAERLRPVRYENTSSEAMFRFTMAQISPENLRIALGAPASAITTTADSVKFTFPKVGGGQRFSVVWESEEEDEYLVIARAASSGSITVPRRKSPDVANIPVEFRVEENSDETILGGEDIVYFCDPALVA